MVQAKGQHKPGEEDLLNSVRGDFFLTIVANFKWGLIESQVRATEWQHHHQVCSSALPVNGLKVDSGGNTTIATIGTNQNHNHHDHYWYKYENCAWAVLHR